MIIKTIATLSLCLLIGLTSTAASASRIKVELKASEKDQAESLGDFELYQESYALVIGNDDYSNGWPRLSNAVKDAEQVASALAKQGYNVDLKTNLTAADLKQAMRNFLIVRGENPEARLILWYAGHGQTVKGEGFLVGTDTPLSTKPEFKLSAIHMRDFGSWVRLAESKHVLAIFDSCFAGTIFTAQRGAPPPAITRATTFPVRQFITSGDADQLVLDNGSFRELFVRALDGDERADINMDGYLTASELGFFLSDRVTNLTQANQTPRYGKLRDKDYDRGDFILAVLAAQKELVDSTSTLQSTKTENLFWEAATELDTKASYQQYIAKYPRGSFAGMATMKLEQLEKSERVASRSAAANTVSETSYRLQASEQRVYVLQSAAALDKPFITANTVATLAKGQALKLSADVIGLDIAWSQIEWEGSTAYMPSSMLTTKKPRQSMADLISAKKAELGLNTADGVSDYRRRQCLRDCEGQSYLSMDSKTRESSEQSCTNTYQEYEQTAYQQCLKTAEQKWRKSRLSNCESKCAKY